MIDRDNPLAELAELTFAAPDHVSLAARVCALTTPSFTFRQLGARHDIQGYLAHLHDLRAGVARGEVTVLDAFVDRSTEPVRAAARVLATMHRHDGATVEGEALLIGVLDGDRVETVHESGRLLVAGDDRPVPTVMVERPVACPPGVLERFPRP